MQKNEKEKLLEAVRDRLLHNEMRIRIHGILGIFQKFYLKDMRQVERIVDIRGGSAYMSVCL